MNTIAFIESAKSNKDMFVKEDSFIINKITGKVTLINAFDNKLVEQLDKHQCNIVKAELQDALADRLIIQNTMDAFLKEYGFLIK